MNNRSIENKTRHRANTKEQGAKPGQNFGLLEDEFEEMVKELKNGNEFLFEKVFLAQFKVCMKYLMNRYNIGHDQAYDVSMDALLKFRKRLLEGKISYGNMRFLFTRMASQFLSNSSKNHTVFIDEYEEKPDDNNPVDDDVLDALDKAWSQLCDECRKILDNFYYKRISLKSLAAGIGKSETALRKRKQRCLEKLRVQFKYYFKN